MEARLSGGKTHVSTTGINPADLTPDTYEYYCRMFLIERIYEIIPIVSNIQYGDVSRLINRVDSILFKDLHLETNKILLLNRIYCLFMESTNQMISKEFLYEKVSHIAKYDPALNGKK